MEPISTLILSVACLAATPSTQRTITGSNESAHHARYLDGDKTTFALPYEANKFFAPSTAIPVHKEMAHGSATVSPRELLKLEAATYSELEPGWNGPSSQVPSSAAVASLIESIDALPARLPLPRPMISESGEPAVYWDLPEGYAEISANPDGTLAFFSRSNAGEEVFEDNLLVERLSPDWFWQQLGPLDEPLRKAA